ncbi:MAG: hypothetical protein J6B85_13645 [Lachnospiraceae bacterium]|nr:hypothetical protein [Lachnospiraceae bacterium]
MSKMVPEPWSPVEFVLEGTKAVAKVWGREYVWEDSLFPVSIQTAGREMLAAPMRLHALFDREEAEVTHTSYTPISAAEDKVVFTVGQTTGNIVINARFTIEYDGYIECALSVIPFWSFSPNHGNVAKLDGLYVEIPMRSENAELFHFWPNGESGIIPDQTIMSSGAVPDEGVDCPFKPYFWAGWEFGGLGLVTESDENIQLKAGTPCISLKKAGERCVLRWNLLNKQPRQWGGRVDRWTDALEPIDYIFGIQATPVKELRPDRMDVKIFHDGYHGDNQMLELDAQGKNLFDHLKDEGVNWIIFHEGWSAIQNYGQAVNEEQFRQYVEECHKRGIKVMAYFGYEYATNAPEWHEKKDDYLIKTPDGHLVGGWQRFNPCQRDYMVCYAGGYAQGMRDRVKYAMEHYHLDGIYTDGTYVPWECANEKHGCGYTDEFGVRHTTFPVFAVRRHVKELYELVHGKGGIIDTHQSSCLMAPTLAFADCFYNGESIQSKLKEDFLGFLNLPAFRTEFMGKNIGLFPQLLATVDEKMPIEKATALSLIHDVLPRPCSLDSVRYVSKFWKALNEFGTGTAEWHPYWEKNGPVTVETENVYCSVYQKENEYLAVLSSFNETAEEAAVRFAGRVEFECEDAEVAAGADACSASVKLPAFQPKLLRFTMR